jgi:hypothetical protein
MSIIWQVKTEDVEEHFGMMFSDEKIKKISQIVKKELDSALLKAMDEVSFSIL